MLKHKLQGKNTKTTKQLLLGLVYNTTSRERIHNLAFTTFSGRTKQR